MKKWFCCISIYFICLNAFPQEAESYINFSLLSDINFVDNNGTIAMGIGHEWLPVPEFGFELGIKGGIGSYNSSSIELDDKFNTIRETHERAECNFEIIDFIPRGYLSISEKNHSVYLGIPLSLYFIQARGTITTYEGKTVKAKQNYAPKLSIGLELGISVSISETVGGKVFLGGNNINFERAINHLDFISSGFKNNISSYLTGFKFGVVFSFHQTGDK